MTDEVTRKVLEQAFERKRAVPDAEEQAVLDHLQAVMDQLQSWGLRVNREEVAQAVHVLQGFAIQRMLHRVEPGHWGTWYADPEDAS